MGRDLPEVGVMSWAESSGPAEHPLPADWSCAKPAEIEHGYVEHLIKYRCDPYYQLRGSGDGEAGGMGAAPRDGACARLQGMHGAAPVPDDATQPPPSSGVRLATPAHLSPAEVQVRLCLPGCGALPLPRRAGVLTPVSLQRHVQV